MIHLKNVRFSWPSSSFGLEVADFFLEKEERLFLYGASGSGKSTFLSLLAGILRAQGGQILIKDQDLAQMSSRKRDRFRAEHIGIVFQQFNLIPYLSVWENVLLGCHFASHRRLRSSADSTQELLQRLGFSTKQCSQPAQYLSVGQQQRVAVARALLGSPELVLADEPTSALDADLKTAFMSLLMELCEERGSTLIFVSHDHSLKDLFSGSRSLKEVIVAQGASQEK